MQNFSKSILNYFAAYNETRFRFTTRVAQQCSNIEYTLDISVFPDFQREIVEQLNRKTGVNINVAKQHYISRNIYKYKF